MNVLNRYAALGAVVAVAILTASMLSRTAFSMYDEGVYYYQSVLLARGEVPYRDYFCPQPPGLLLIGAASESIGAGLTGVRALNWLCGLALLVLTYRLARRAGGENAAASAALAPIMVAVTVVFAYQSVQGATNMPAAALELAACVLLFSAHRRRFEWSGLTLAAATALRLQSLVAVPGLLLLIRLADGRAGFAGRSGRFLAGLAIGLALIHLPAAVLVPNYVDNAFGFHLERVRTDWQDRRGQIEQMLAEPPAIVGILAAAWHLKSGGPAIRGLAAHALITTALVAVAGKSLSVMYFLPVLPLLTVCAAAVVPARAPIATGMLVIATLAYRGPAVVGMRSAIMAPEAAHAACIAAIREAPGRTVLAVDGRIAVLAGKVLPADYYSTDPNALVQTNRARFHEWFDCVLPQADAVVVTGLLVEWMSSANASRLMASGKPLYFDEDATRLLFNVKFRDVATSDIR